MKDTTDLLPALERKKRGGSVAIYVTLDLEAEFKHTDEHNESISVKVSGFKKTKKVIVSCFYCEPSRNKSKYLDHVEEVLEINGCGLQIACGGFNIDMLNENLATRVLLEYLMYSQRREIERTYTRNIYIWYMY